ncbi:rna-binding protein [Vairimorpha apis BRL 01]|uniref:Rna-binding protein n=1 Tax=Vairimorpha apis BRL 01 TaxID=1037528 RepID=T0L722_9MICR|nr:rna-binding protein [Vairimorpha apis BRL 01]
MDYNRMDEKNSMNDGRMVDGNMNDGRMDNGNMIDDKDKINSNTKNKFSNTDIEEASLMALCNSKCWEQQIISPVFYVSGEQVSKTPPTGQFVSKGSFIIRGNKTFINVHKLEYGLGILFKVSGDGCSEGFSVCEGFSRSGDVQESGIDNGFSRSGDGRHNSVCSKARDSKCNEGQESGINDGFSKCNEGQDRCIDDEQNNTNKNDYFIKHEGSIFVVDPKNYDIDFAFPVCAPYKVLQNYKYKVRLLPGKEKKGKIVQNIMKGFISKGDERVIQKLKLISVEVLKCFA